MRQRFIMRHNLSRGFLLVTKSKIPFGKHRIHQLTFFTGFKINHQRFLVWKSVGKRTWNDLFLMKTHQSLFQYLLYWHKHVQNLIVPDDWGDPAPWSRPMILPHDTSKVCFRILQNTKGPFSRKRNSWYDSQNDDNFPKVPVNYFVEKIWMTQ